MTSLSDTLTVGLVLVLLFGSIALYLYTRIQQAEQKLSLLESILLDLKMSSEIKSYSELPASNVDDVHATHSSTQYQPFNEEELDNYEEEDVYPGAVLGGSSSPKKGSPANSVSGSINEVTDFNEVTDYKSIIAEAVNSDADVKDSDAKVSVNYESMTLKELQTLAKSRGISGAGSMKKNAIIEALKTSDRSSSPIEPGSLGNGMSSFLETSSPFQTSTAESE
jgi:hypothetical protein